MPDYVDMKDGDKIVGITQPTVNEWAQEWVDYCNKKLNLTMTLDSIFGDMVQIEK